jgi:hypothetical protein
MSQRTLCLIVFGVPYAALVCAIAALCLILMREPFGWAMLAASAIMLVALQIFIRLVKKS